MIKLVGFFMLFVSICCFVLAIFSGVAGYMTPTGSHLGCESILSNSILVGKILLVLSICLLIYDKHQSG